MSLKLVHSVKKPEVETAERKAPGIDEHQNTLAAIDRIREVILAYGATLNETSHSIERVFFTIAGCKLEEYELECKAAHEDLKKRFFNKGKNR